MSAQALPEVLPTPLTRPRLRVLPAPTSTPEPSVQPPRERESDPHQGMLDLDLVRRAPAAGPTLVAQPADDCDPRPKVLELPDPYRTATALAPAVVEVLNGTRPASQLVRWTTREVQVAVARRAAIGARMGRRQMRGRPPVVRAVRVCRPARHVAEASAVIVEADRVRAVAIRLEVIGGRWRATDLEVG